MLGIDIASRTDLSQLLVRPPRAELEGKDRYYAWLQSLLGPVAGYGLNLFATTPRLYADGHTWRAVETALPKFARDVMRAARYESEGVTNIKGNALIERELDAWEIGTQAIGFVPSTVAEAQAANAAIRTKERILNRQRSRLLDRHYVASAEERIQIRLEIREFNEQHPTHRIDLRTLFRSVRARDAARRETEGGIRLPDRHEPLREVGRFAERQ